MTRVNRATARGEGTGCGALETDPLAAALVLGDRHGFCQRGSEKGSPWVKAELHGPVALWLIAVDFALAHWCFLFLLVFPYFLRSFVTPFGSLQRNTFTVKTFKHVPK